MVILFKFHERTLIWPMLLCALMGFSFDLAMSAFGVIAITDAHIVHNLWLLAIWLLFVASYHFMFFWTSNLPSIVIALLGAAGGIASYYAASLLGAVTILSMESFLVVYGVFWAALFLVGKNILVARQLTQAR